MIRLKNIVYIIFCMVALLFVVSCGESRKGDYGLEEQPKQELSNSGDGGNQVQQSAGDGLKGLFKTALIIFVAVVVLIVFLYFKMPSLRNLFKLTNSEFDGCSDQDTPRQLSREEIELLVNRLVNNALSKKNNSSTLCKSEIKRYITELYDQWYQDIVNDVTIRIKRELKSEMRTLVEPKELPKSQRYKQEIVELETPPQVIAPPVTQRVEFLYADSVVEKDGQLIFSTVTPLCNDASSIYNLEVTGNSATYGVLSSTFDIIVQEPTYVDLGCALSYSNGGSRTQMKVIEKGSAQRTPSGDWQITQKCKIKFF